LELKTIVAFGSSLMGHYKTYTAREGRYFVTILSSNFENRVGYFYQKAVHP
jgi:hypothetical protein